MRRRLEVVLARKAVKIQSRRGLETSVESFSCLTKEQIQILELCNRFQALLKGDAEVRSSQNLRYYCGTMGKTDLLACR